MRNRAERLMKFRQAKILFLFALVFGATDTLPTNGAQNDPAIAKPKQKTFASPDDLATAYVTACEQQDTAALRALLGPGSEELINSGDETQDQRRRERFSTMAKEVMQVRPDPYNLDRFLIYVGERQWPLPIPIVKDGNAFRFDTAAAKTEILARRVGRNELDAIAFLREIVQAQIDFAYADQKEFGIREYAQNIISNSDKHNGLYWDAKDGEPASPLADAINKAVSQGYELPQPGEPFLYHGYIFRVLLAQGPNAPGGARDYVLQDKMMGGFAAVAYPVEYGTTGVKTFLVNQDGTVQEKDLGANSNKLADSIKTYNPDKTWSEAPREETEAEAKPTKP
jgi:Protein of unknown function (DUF2950)